MPAEVNLETALAPDGSALVSVIGEVDISNVEILRGAVESLLEQGRRAIVFDLRRLTFIDSAGLAMLASAARRVDSIALRDPSPIVRRVIDVSGLGSVLPIER